MIGFRGLRSVATIDYRITAHDWPFATGQALAIDAFWRDAVAANPALFNGRVFVAHRMRLAGDHFEAEGFETGYKAFLAWRDMGFPGAPVANLFSMGALRSGDGAFMLGRMAAHTASAGKLYFPAGTPEPADADAAGVVDLEANILRELREETGFLGKDLTMGAGWTLVFDGPRVACMRALSCPLSAAAMVARFNAFRDSESEPELDALVPVRGPDDLDAARMPPFMLTYLRAAFAES